MTQRAATRRRVLLAAGVGVGLAGASSIASAVEEKENKVGAVEDLMREHGVLRRCLIVYSEVAARLRGGDRVDPQLIQHTAELFRRFGEGYHEMQLEELHIFPKVKEAGGTAATLVDVLMAQHSRGREITAYILQVATKGSVGPGKAGPVARALDSFVRMYRAHAAREDTVVFPAWKAALSDEQVQEMSEKFEDIERQNFGHDGFEDAVKQIAKIEHALDLGDLAKFTAPAMS